MKTYYIEELDTDGKTVATISGLGRNRGKLDTAANSLRTARRWLRQMRAKYPAKRYTIGTL